MKHNNKLIIAALALGLHSTLSHAEGGMGVSMSNINMQSTFTQGAISLWKAQNNLQLTNDKAAAAVQADLADQTASSTQDEQNTNVSNGTQTAVPIANQTVLNAAEIYIGNGGGAWVCSDQQGNIQKELLVDTFEAQSQFGLKIAQYPGQAGDIVDLVMLRLYRLNPELAAQIQDRLDTINNLEANPPKIIYTEDTLSVINDQGLHTVVPGANRCPGGVIQYGQIVNFNDQSGNILVQTILLNALSETDKAALIVHEAVYKYLRDQNGDKNSARTRKIVGLLFSTLSQTDLKTQIEAIFGGGFGPGPIGMEFVKIRAGQFLMGSPTNEVGRYDDEAQHWVQLAQDFEMEATDVTQKQYYDVMGVNPSKFNAYTNCPDPKKFLAVPGTTLCINNPVEQVSWDDAEVFIQKLNATQHDGYQYRLPTEEEWEYAARGAGTNSPYIYAAYYFGNDPNQLPLYAWYAWFGEGAIGSTHEVKLKPANPWGLYDMEGNVWQWTADIYSKDYMARSPQNAPQAPYTTAAGSARIFRGGSWDDNAQGARSADRCSYGPGYHFSNVGLRLVRTRLP